MFNPFLIWLEKQCHRVADLEKQGKEYASKADSKGYRNIMLEKAELLADLFENGHELAETLPSELQNKALRALRGFSANANRAIELDSVFFMSALLYRDKQPINEPNSLEKFQMELRVKLEKEQLHGNP